MFILSEQLSIEQAREKIGEFKGKHDVRVSRTCENHCDFSHNTVNIDVYPKGKTHPFDVIGKYHICCSSQEEADRFFDTLHDAQYGGDAL